MLYTSLIFQTALQNKKSRTTTLTVDDRPTPTMLTKAIPTEDIFSLTTEQPSKADPSSPNFQRLHRCHLTLNHSNTEVIRTTPKDHSHADSEKRSSETIACSAGAKDKMARAPHQRAVHTLLYVTVISTDVGGPVHRPGPNGNMVCYIHRRRITVHICHLHAHKSICSGLH